MKARVLMAALVLTACGGPPTETLTSAETALQDAALAKRCAKDEYAAAERMYKQAQEESAAGNYEEAKSSAEAAKKLAIHARNKALLNQDACEAAERAEAERLAAEEASRQKTIQVHEEAAAYEAGEADLSFKMIHFGFNTSEIAEPEREILSEHASKLEANPSVKLVIGGHCDTRGSTEYNLALGEKRAQVVRKYLVSMGVEASRLSIISYGEEEPLTMGTTEADHRKNRRAEFKIK